MSQKHFVLAPLFACSLLLVMGALHHQPLFLSSAIETSFVAQPVSPDADLEKLAPAQLLARAADILAPDKLHWLRVNIWQKQVDGEMRFEAEGRLVRGPHQCARLEMKVHTGKETTAIVTVSDGVDMAHGCRRVGQPIEISSQRFVSPEKKTMTAAQIDQILNAHGCGGPKDLLKDLQSRLGNLQAVRGTWNNKAVFRLTGSLKGIPSDERPAVSARICHLFLDARTLWPHRVEWWTSARAEDAELFLQLEFRDPEINHPFSHEECVREFTFLAE